MQHLRKILDSTFLFLLSGAGLLAFFVILCGARTTGVLTKFYWLKADTSGIPNAPSETYWLNYMYCSKDNGTSYYHSCSSKEPAYPFSPRNNFKTTLNVPSSFVNDRDKYYYLSRVGWSMWLVGLLFLSLSLIPMLVALFISIPKIYIISTLLLWSAWFYLTLGACLWTSCFVLGKNAFKDAGRSAHLGVKMFAFIWTTVFIITLCSLWHPISGLLAKRYNNIIAKQNSDFEASGYSTKENGANLEEGRGNNETIASDSDSYINNKNSEYSAGTNNNLTENTAYSKFYNKSAKQAGGAGVEESNTSPILNVPFQNKNAKEETPVVKNLKESSSKYVYSSNDPSDVNKKVEHSTVVGDGVTSEVIAATTENADANGTVTDYYKKQKINYG